MTDEVVDLNVEFNDGSHVKIQISEFDNHEKVIAALRKISETSYLLGLYDALRGYSDDEDDEDDEDWDDE